MKHLSIEGKKVMDILTDGIDDYDQARKIQNNPSKSIMAVHVEMISKISKGPIYSIAHYYEQNGDLMKDPDMTFLKGADGEYYPLSYQQDGLGIYQDAVDWDDNGNIKGFRVKMQADMTSFANDWMENIKNQQKL
jgi:hypothetical protein